MFEVRYYLLVKAAATYASKHLFRVRIDRVRREIVPKAFTGPIERSWKGES